MKILLGVSGGVAAYKSPEILRALQEAGASVQVTLTASAQRFVTPLTFQALSGTRVHTDLWADEEPAPGQPIEHIAVAQWADVVLVAPATAHTMARLAHGFADDFLAATCLATQARLVLAPAMNMHMWQHPATQANLRVLQSRGAVVVPPGDGYLACGLTGPGRLAAVETIVAATLAAQKPQDLADEVVLVTAGGTREPLDTVRFLGNRSSGRMGYALAEAARDRGASVVLIAAPTALPPPSGCEVYHVETAEQMGAALQQHLQRATLVLAAAAVADFRPVSPLAGKLRREGTLRLELEATPDLVAQAAAQRRPHTRLIAFAAETDDLETKARAKLRRKGVDAIVANLVGRAGTGFDAGENCGLFLTGDITTTLPLESKRQMADRIMTCVLEQLPASHAGVLTG